MKYKHESDIDMSIENAAHTKILKMVKPNSKVLEFGSAHGDMTKYLANELGCEVYIIEIDKDAFSVGMEFAKDGYCGDASSYEWLEKFSSHSFDYILFADVLEHLYDPKNVLIKSLSLLNEGGRVLLSVPNIAHSSIIVNLINNKFEYRKTGLLDNAHIRFFTYSSLNEMLDYAGLIATTLDAVYVPLEYTEFNNDYADVQGNADIIKNRPYENVYQFVFETVKKDYYYENKDAIDVDSLIIQNAQQQPAAKIYFDTGGGFNEEEVQSISYDGVNFYGKVDLTSNIIGLRFDPTEGFICAVKNLEILSSEGRLDYESCNGFVLGDYHLFLSDDPNFVVTMPPSISWVSVDAKIFIVDETYLPSLLSNVRKLCNTVEKQHTDISNLTQEMEQSKSAFAKNVAELKADILKGTEAMEEQTAVMERLLEELESENKRQLEEIESRKQRQLAGLYDEKQQEITSLEMQLSDAIIQANLLQHDYNNIINSRIWKLTKPYRYFGLAIKNTAYRILPLRLLVKFIKRVFKSGPRVAFRYVRAYLARDRADTSHTSGYVVQKYSEKDLYDSEYQINYDFSKLTPDIKVLAFYLPQFHRIAENDKWWGEGFTEWTNTSKATPSFFGHYQPREPHGDIGQYRLDTMESFVATMTKQAKLAKQHGVHGFCFYYYWFSGKRLLEKPVDMLLQNPNIDINFCLCWANENWTRTWDGQNQHVLMGQNHAEDDPLVFIDDIKKYVSDTRYIRVEGKPVIVVYNPSTIPNCKTVFRRWRERARIVGVGEILIWICQTAGQTVSSLGLENSVDMGIEFPPHGCGEIASFMPVAPLDVGHTFDYTSLVKIRIDEMKHSVGEKNHFPVYKTPMMAWDNAARRKTGWRAFYSYSLRSFYDWCFVAADYTRQNFEGEHRFMFINAWNEWAEGTYLEPDKKYGYANINTLSKAIHNLPFDSIYASNSKLEIKDDKGNTFNVDSHFKGDHVRIAVQIHLYYTELMEEVIEAINCIPYKFDCYISTDTSVKKAIIEDKFSLLCNANKVHVEVFDNRGRDVAPFLIQMRDTIDNYDYICHIHTKKTLTTNWGDDWRKYLYNSLFGSADSVRDILGVLSSDNSVGVIFPETYPELLVVRGSSLESYMLYSWGTDVGKAKKELTKLLSRMELDITLPKNPTFPAGNMFWAKTAAVKNIFKLNLTGTDFPEEKGQEDETFAHIVERHWVYAAEANGYRSVFIPKVAE